jgi:putative FmdB family regulatory protein
MPFYTYRPRDPNKSCKYCRDDFEIVQKITEDALQICPDCGNEVVRIIFPARQSTEVPTDKLLSDDNIKKHGFKKLRNVGGGKFDEVV